MAQTLVKSSMLTVASNAQTGTTYTILATDRGKVVSLSNAASIAVTLPQATGSFGAGFSVDVVNIGAGRATLTPTTSTINGNASTVLYQGEFCKLISDGTNWLAMTPQATMSRNRIINGCMRINQRAAATNADDTYALDRWNILTQTSTVAVTQITDVENTTPHMMRITQSQASAQRFGVEQIIEAANCKDLRGQSVTLSARVRCSNSTTLRYAIIEWTGTANTVTSDFINDWTSGTYTAGNFFTSTSTTVTATGSTALTANTLATVSLSATLGSSTNNLVVLFWTDSTQAQNSTLDIGNAQLELGPKVTAFEREDITVTMARCLRYYWAQTSSLIGAWGATTTAPTIVVQFPVRMRSVTTAILINGTVNGGSALEVEVAQRSVSAVVSNPDSDFGGRFIVTTAAATANRPCVLEYGTLAFSAEI